jgi:hypothetical protein
MAANVQPIFTRTPKVATAIIPAASGISARDGSGSLTLLVNPGSDGSRIERIKFTGASSGVGVASSAMVGRVYIVEAGVTALIDEVAIAAATPSSSVIGPNSTISYPGGLIIGASQKVFVSKSTSGAQDALHVMAQYGDY